MFDVDYFIEQTRDFIHVVRDLPEDISSRDPIRVDCSKRKGQFDYVEHVLPFLLKHRYISITPAMSQRRDRCVLVDQLPCSSFTGIYIKIHGDI